MSEKLIVCACEDVTAHELDKAIAQGFTDIESIKRYTGLGTGPCQGKSCVSGAIRCLRAREALPVGELDHFRTRPPLQPTALRQLAGLPLEMLPLPMAETAQRGQREIPESVRQRLLRPVRSAVSHAPLDRKRNPLPEKTDVVIIGGGIMGLALAWHLAGNGVKVLVLERGYLCAGASGRNGGGVRAQWTTPTLIELAKESIEFMSGFAQTLGINVWFRKGGYLFLAHDEPTLKRMEESAALQKRHGLPTRIIGPGEARDIVPELDSSRFIAASWNPDDGVVFPWPFVWGYADGAQKRGAQVETFTRVTGLDVSEGRIRGVRTDVGTVKADRVVLAAGAWSPEIAKFANVSLPNVPYRHEIVSSEPLKPFLGPLVSMLGTGLYFSQSMRGEIVGGMGDPDEPPGLNQESSARFLARYARALTEIMPRVGEVKLLRQWAGCYDVTPDHSPILGETPGVAGLLQMSGFVGHGFMMAPAVGRRMAEWMGGAKDEMFERYSLSRFAEGRLEPETFIIG
ncbi:MAG: FAD-dependent oxidoreductase [Deltaproteobacteria bacterium]|nr:FAD-dependent oxidoreductase [Deltaproteobacteria bacterium]